MIAVNSGMRLSEQYGLDWSQVDLEQRVIRIPRSKNGGARHVRISTTALPAFQEALSKNGEVKRGLVFHWVTASDAARHEWFNDAVKKAGIDDFRWHDLRHTFASRLVMDGKPLRAVQELLGHKTIQMTCRYAHLAPSVELDAVDEMGASWSQKVEAAAKKLNVALAERSESSDAPQETATDTRTDSAQIAAASASE